MDVFPSTVFSRVKSQVTDSIPFLNANHGPACCPRTHLVLLVLDWYWSSDGCDCWRQTSHARGGVLPENHECRIVFTARRNLRFLIQMDSILCSARELPASPFLSRSGPIQSRNPNGFDTPAKGWIYFGPVNVHQPLPNRAPLGSLVGQESDL